MKNETVAFISSQVVALIMGQNDETDRTEAHGSGRKPEVHGMSHNTPLHILGSQDGLSVIGDTSLFDAPHWTFVNADAPSLAYIWSTVENGGNTHASHAPDPTVDANAASLQADALVGAVHAASGGDDAGSGPLPAYTIRIPISDHVDGPNVPVDDASVVDGSQYQLASSSSDEAEGNSFTAGWPSFLDAANAQAQSFHALGSPGDTMGPSSEPDTSPGAPADAKGGNGGGPPGGGGGGGHGGGGGGGGNGGGGDPGLPASYTSGDPNVDDGSEFNIHIDFSGSWTAQEQAIATWAADLWSSIVVADVRDDTDLSGNFVDDIVIAMSVGRIDGSGNPKNGDILAQTQITAVRDPGSVDEWLPVTSSIKLDSTDLNNSIADGWSGTWDAIVLHEMGHALGFAGIIFDNLGLVDSFGNFIGTDAVAAYGGPVPLENNGGAGTAGSHWDEDTFAPNPTGDPSPDLMPNELMTGWLAMNEQTYLSDTTVGALADLGYHVQDPSAGAGYLVIDNNLLLA